MRIGIIGTLTAPMAAARSATRARRAEFDLQRQERNEERAHADRRAAYEEKRDAYMELNATVRGFRTAAETYLRDLIADPTCETPPMTSVDEALQPYRSHYARVQMLRPERPMIITSEVNRSINSVYEALVKLQQTYDARMAEELQKWMYGGVSEAVWVLRQVLREDLGVGEPLTDFHGALRLLQDVRKASIDAGKRNRGLGIDAVGGYTSGIEANPAG
ncbi:hypothetical protein [Streptomyces avermitilis]|uniref:hypothetical protein n=1 Tax=Streptomyces avermitilis TaxID=33903 RepID=UPI00367517BA